MLVQNGSLLQSVLDSKIKRNCQFNFCEEYAVMHRWSHKLHTQNTKKSITLILKEIIQCRRGGRFPGRIPVRNEPPDIRIVLTLASKNRQNHRPSLGIRLVTRSRHGRSHRRRRGRIPPNRRRILRMSTRVRVKMKTTRVRVTTKKGVCLLT